MTSKTCTKCEHTKSKSEFSARSKSRSKLQSWCKSCLSKHNRDKYKNGIRREQVKANSARYRKQIEKFLVDFLRNNPCVNCGETNILTLQFDHITDKRYNVSCLIRHSSLQLIKNEISKCQVLCANCHSIKTHQENNSWKLKFT
jgi:hypothetical protein